MSALDRLIDNGGTDPRPYRPKQQRGKHATPWHQKIAEGGTILRTEVGSGVHGTAINGQDDRDEMGVCVEPPEVALGLRTFEQYEHHTAWEREGGLTNRSGPGDLDVVIYSLRKYVRLAMSGNPSVLVPLFAPPSAIVRENSEGRLLRTVARERIVSRMAGDRFLGYLHAQRRSMLSNNASGWEGKGRDVTRKDLIQKYGYDTKFAGHMARLGFQGIELLRTGSITLPMPASERTVVRYIRQGYMNMEQALEVTAELEAELQMLNAPACAISPLRAEPDYEWINAWLAETYQHNWMARNARSAWGL